MTRQPDVKFAAWALTYQGMDGGNVNAELWFCGIEQGTGENLNIESVEEIKSDCIVFHKDERIPYVDTKCQLCGSDNSIKPPGPFALAQSKMADLYYGDGKNIKNWEDLSGINGRAFKMNLYPIAFRADKDNLWTKDHYRITGFVSKSEYKSWCLHNRFPKLKYLVNTYNPKVLICFGITMQREYLTAFCDNDDQIFEQPSEWKIGNDSDKSNRTLIYRTINNGKTLLLITPFPSGAHGLNSNKLLEEVATFAKKQTSLLLQCGS